MSGEYVFLSFASILSPQSLYFLFDSFFFFRVISDKKALSVIACYLGQGLELIAFVYVAVNFLFRLILIFPMFETR